MKKYFLLIGIFLILFTKIFSQDTLSKWKVQLYSGIEEHDKRLFDYVDKDKLLYEKPERWGTYHFGINFYRKLLQYKIFFLHNGLGINYEKATFHRPFNHWYFQDDRTKILLLTDKYEKLLIPFKSMFSVKCFKYCFLNIEFNSYFTFLRRIDNSRYNSDSFPMSKWTFEFEKFNIKPGFEFKFGNFSSGINIRLFNYQKIDKIIFNYIVKDPRKDQTWEKFNPRHYDFTIGYTW